jgi:hypothetical protein
MKSKYGKKEKKNENDQFYTSPDYAQKCINTLNEFFDISSFDICIEPSAGTGSFSNKLPENSIAYDLDPKDSKIIKQDFFTVKYDRGNILVIGNPPFGRVCSTAIKFFNHAAKFADVIAFIIPQTFQRLSIQNKLDLNFHLIYNEDINERIFTPDMAAKCCFQIWKRKDTKREKVTLKTIHKDWTFLPFGPIDDNGQPTPPENADFAFLAFGGKIGKIQTENLKDLRPKSWHWIKTPDPDLLIKRFESLDYSISNKTVRQNSLGRGELVWLYEQKYG